MACNNMMTNDQLEVENRRSPLITKFMYSLFEKQMMCDVYLICCDGHVGAHKLVLGSNSVVFSKQFDQNIQPRCQQKPIYNPNKRQQHCNATSFNQNYENMKQKNPPLDLSDQLINRYNQCKTDPCDAIFRLSNFPGSDARDKSAVGSRRPHADMSISSLIKCLPQKQEQQQQMQQQRQQPCYQHQQCNQPQQQFPENQYKQTQQQQPCDQHQYPQLIHPPQQQQQQQPCSQHKPTQQNQICNTLNDYLKDMEVPRCSNVVQEPRDRYLISSRGRQCPGRYNLKMQVENLKQTLKSQKQDMMNQPKSQQQPHQPVMQNHFFTPLCNCISTLMKYNCDEGKKYLANNNDNNNGLKSNKHSNNSNNNGYNGNKNMQKDDAISNSNMHNLCQPVYSNNNINSNAEDEEMPGVIHLSLEKYNLEVICVLIHFIYTGDSSHINGDNMDLLLQLSLEFQMPLLHKACVKHIISTINANNVSFYLLLVDKYDMKNIRKVVLCFMLENMVEVMQSHDFLKLPHPWVKIIMGSQEARGMIAAECNNSEDQIELMIFDALVRWIDYDRATRGPLAPSLMGEVVHLEALSVQQLVETVESIEWLVQMPEVRDILTSIYKAKLLMQKNQQYRVLQNVPSCKHVPCGVTNFDSSY